MDKEKRERLAKQFYAEPFVRALGIILYIAEDKSTVTGMGLKEDFLTHHDLITGGIHFYLANAAGVYAAMTELHEGEDVILASYSARNRRPTILEEDCLTAHARVSGERMIPDKSEVSQRIIDVEVKIYGYRGDTEKALIHLEYAVRPKTFIKESREDLQRRIAEKR